ncbi:MAG: S-layer homology domain-containing protein, partial [Clostridia bacterium]|nr:S-layer homology domain-containing protein [Clostridia bacterium]
LDVEYAFENGLMQGTAEDKFSPYVNTSRGMIVTILWRLEGSPDVTGRCQFADVKPGSYYEKAVIWATENGIVKGYSTTKFGPDDDINREQLATLIYRYAEYKGYDVSARTNLSAYSDLSKISSFATEQMSWANAVGLINGTTPTTLNPGGLAQRCQAAAVFHRFLTGFAK